MGGGRGPQRGTPSLFGDESPPDELRPAQPPAASVHARVSLNRPMRVEYTYAVPDALRARIAPGMRVAVPFGPAREVGVVVAVGPPDGSAPARLRPIARVLDEEPVVGGELLGLTRWIAERWACSWGEALAAILPAPLKRERGARKVLVAEATEAATPDAVGALEERSPKQHRLLRTLVEIGAPVELREVCRRVNVSDAPARSLARRGLLRLTRVDARPDELLSSTAERSRPERLTPAQEAAVARIGSALEAERFAAFLLQGVTGSGKTEVYLRAIERAVELGRGAIVLVPEIALTPQTVGWFRSRFGEIAVLHSRMTDVQRLAMWRRVKRGEARVVVGARSAVFAPVERLGVVVVDEEHEPSFKQANAPRYHARDVAMERARRAGAVCVLGSATPSLETWSRANAGANLRDQRSARVERISLPERIGGAPMPRVDVVDLRVESEPGRGVPLFSRLLCSLLAETLDGGEQAILFLNRRGFTPVLWCPGCRTAVRCEACDMALTFHRRIGRMVCHGCCEERSVPIACPTCTRPGLKAFGSGSERVEAELRALLPRARVRRMDSDTMRRREDYEEALGAFGRRELDVLVGTQMIAKGLDFPGVVLVGIVSADQSLHLPDFRAAERTFQLVSQVAGRAGRGTSPGRIVVQTIAPAHHAIRHAARHDFEAFAREEDEMRRELGYPPHGELVRVTFEDEDEAQVARAGEECARLLEATLAESPDATVLGPAPAPIALLRGRHRHHLLVKAPLGDACLARARDALIDFAARTSRPRVSIDVGPASML